MERYRIVRKEQLTVARWSGGTTTQLAIWPLEGDYAQRRFTWRVSSARVEDEESTFTSLSGVERCLMILEGTLWLEHEGHYETVLHPFEQDNFSGGWTTRSRGRVTDFNLMVKGGEGRVQVTEIGAAREVPLMPVVEGWRCVSEVFYFLCDAEVTLPDGARETLHAGDVLQLHAEAPGGAERLTLAACGAAMGRAIRCVIYHD